MSLGQSHGILRVSNAIDWNEWMHLAITLEYDHVGDSNVARFYKNGVEVKSKIIDDWYTDNAFTDNFLGHSVFAERKTMIGDFDNVRMHNRILSSNKIYNSYITRK